MKTTARAAFLAFLMFSMMVGPTFGKALLVSQRTIDGRADATGLCADAYSSVYTHMMLALTAGFQEVLCVTNLENEVLFKQYDALWLDLRSTSDISHTSGSLTDLEVSNIAAFIQRGRKVVMIGEWGRETPGQPTPLRYEAWDNQILGIVGGSYAGAYSGSISQFNPHPIIADELTEGVLSLDLYRNNYGTAKGGTPLFWPAIANLWGLKGNALTILDTAFYDDGHWEKGDNARFAQNVAKWLATPVLTPPPTAVCEDVTVTAGPACTASASIDGGSFDPTGAPFTCSQLPAEPYPLGNTLVTLTATRDESASSSQCVGTVSVVDRTPPTMTTISAAPSVLWPPNQKMVTVTIDYGSADNCGLSKCRLSSVTSSDPISSSDYAIVDEHHVKLKAERLGKGQGRTYVIAVTCADSAGNSSVQAATVTVPHDQGKD